MATEAIEAIARTPKAKTGRCHCKEIQGHGEGPVKSNGHRAHKKTEGKREQRSPKRPGPHPKSSTLFRMLGGRSFARGLAGPAIGVGQNLPKGILD